jgi:hypothetical protein
VKITQHANGFDQWIIRRVFKIKVQQRTHQPPYPTRIIGHSVTDFGGLARKARRIWIGQQLSNGLTQFFDRAPLFPCIGL